MRMIWCSRCDQTGSFSNFLLLSAGRQRLPGAFPSYCDSYRHAPWLGGRVTMYVRANQWLAPRKLPQCVRDSAVPCIYDV